jgi:hypothetical protein
VANAVLSAGHGTVYCVTGGGGAPLYEVREADFIATGSKEYHHVRVHYTPGRLECTAVDNSQAVIDRFTIVSTIDR